MPRGDAAFLERMLPKLSVPGSLPVARSGRAALPRACRDFHIPSAALGYETQAVFALAAAVFAGIRSQKPPLHQRNGRRTAVGVLLCRRREGRRSGFLSRKSPLRALAEQSDAEEEVEESFLCGACGIEMVSMAHWQGSKVQPNPQGMPFYIAKFSSVEGAEVAGAAHTEDSFFPGWTWRMCLCRDCGTHVGWMYERGEEGPFWGLMMHRLEKSRSGVT
mmetsp:Transcript_19944/g.56224  ORF Transcript_19944/g.56224 Transcript_19944/m.56224 type:complete len:219 (+) Transcript_19944:61-717(+)